MTAKHPVPSSLNPAGAPARTGRRLAGLAAAGAALAAASTLLAMGSDRWVDRGFASSLPQAVAIWGAAPTEHVRAVAVPRAGDEGYWLRRPGLLQPVANRGAIGIGDHLPLEIDGAGARDYEVVAVEVLQPQSMPAAEPGRSYLLVTARPFAAPAKAGKSASAVVRFVIEREAPGAPLSPAPPPRPAEKAL
jgi:hypothetical protein